MQSEFRNSLPVFLSYGFQSKLFYCLLVEVVNVVEVVSNTLNVSFHRTTCFIYVGVFYVLDEVIPISSFFYIRSMEGICFEVKPRDDPIKDHPLSALTQTLPGSVDKRKKEEGEEEIKYRLTLVGSLAIHPQTTMTMLPWVVAEIRRPRPGEKNGNHEFNGTCSPEVSLFIHVWKKNTFDREKQQCKA